MSEKIYNMVDLETIEKLADLVAAKDLGEITIADGEKTITVKGKKCLPPMPLSEQATATPILPSILLTLFCATYQFPLVVCVM